MKILEGELFVPENKMDLRLVSSIGSKIVLC